MAQFDLHEARFLRKGARKRSPRPRLLGLETLEQRVLMTLEGNQLFPADNPWNQKIASAPVAANSSTLVGSIGASSSLHPDFGTTFGGALNGIPYNVVPGTQPTVNVVLDAYADESDPLPVPIPSGVVIEGDPLPPAQNTSDRHLLVYDQDHKVAYELFNVHRPSEEADQRWHADSEAVWDMSQDSFRTPGFTSADAAGLPILPGLVRPDEVLDQGVINHALRFTVPRSDSSYVFPASHEAGVDNPAYPRMGERFRLKQSFDISGFPAADRVILQALKDYGMIVADNGSGWFLGGTPSSRWNDDDLHKLTQVLGSNFEAVNLAPIVSGLDQTSGPRGGGTAVTIHGQDFSGAAGQLKVLFGATPATSVTIVSDTTLVAIAPAHAPGAVDVTVQTPYGTSPATASDRFTFTTTSGATVAGTHLFYNQSKFDGNNSALNAGDDGAIATDKSAYVPGSGTATFASVSNYTLGINGIMVDISGSHGTFSASDFIFKTGNNNSPAGWTTVAAAATIATRGGVPTAGTDRVEIVWPNGAIRQSWLEVVVKGNDALGGNDSNTGLAASAVFFWGNSVADDGNLPDDSAALRTDAADELGARNNPKTLVDNIPVSNLYDYNRDGQVSAIDQLAARNNPSTDLTAPKYINVVAAGPFAPNATPAAPLTAPAAGITTTDASKGDVGLALGMALTPGAAPPGWPTPQSGRNIDLTSGPADRLFQTVRDLQTTIAADPMRGASNLDDAVLDQLLADLGLD